jgi:anti-sigma factor RsiW
MSSKNSHLSDEELLLAADGELPAARAEQVAAHLSVCWACRVRKGEIDAAIGDFVRLYRSDLDPLLPSPDGPRALLKAQLAEMTRQVVSALHSSLCRRRFFRRPSRAAGLFSSIAAAFSLCAGIVSRAEPYSGRDCAGESGANLPRDATQEPHRAGVVAPQSI